MDFVISFFIQRLEFQTAPKWLLKQLCQCREVIATQKDKENQRIEIETSELKAQLKDALAKVQEKDFQLKISGSQMEVHAQKVPTCSGSSHPPFLD